MYRIKVAGKKAEREFGHMKYKKESNKIQDVSKISQKQYCMALNFNLMLFIPMKFKTCSIDYRKDI